MNKNKNTIHDQKHLSLSDRTYIEQELLQLSTFKSIAAVLHKNPSTISKEVRLHSESVHTVKPYCKLCLSYDEFNSYFTT